MMVNLVYRCVRMLVNLVHQYSGRMEQPLCLAYAIMNLFQSRMLVVDILANQERYKVCTSK